SLPTRKLLRACTGWPEERERNLAEPSSATARLRVFDRDRGIPPLPEVMVGKTFNDAKGNTELRKCLDRRGRLFHIQLHFFFCSDPSGKKAQIGEPLFIGIFHPSGALKLVVGSPKAAVGVGGSAAHNRCFFHDGRL